jgi:hypothetical protein
MELQKQGLKRKVLQQTPQPRQRQQHHQQLKHPLQRKWKRRARLMRHQLPQVIKLWSRKQADILIRPKRQSSLSTRPPDVEYEYLAKTPEKIVLFILSSPDTEFGISKFVS